MDDRDRDIARALDTVVGEEYRPRAAWRARISKWLAAALLALAAAAVIAWILHRHIGAAQTAPPPPRPVTVEIVPAK